MMTPVPGVPSEPRQEVFSRASGDPLHELQGREVSEDLEKATEKHRKAHFSHVTSYYNMFLIMSRPMKACVGPTPAA